MELVHDARWETFSVCGRANVVYGPGEASCTSVIASYIDVSSTDEVLDIISKYENILNHSGDLFINKDANMKYPDLSNGLVPHSEDFKYGYASRALTEFKSQIGCGMEYELNYIDNEQSKINFITGIHCGGPARDTWFPRNDS